LLENSGTETQTTYHPGHSSYQANGNAYWNSAYGGVNQNTAAHSVGPSVSTSYFPWAVYSVWVYTPSNLGVVLGDSWTIRDFYLNSDAESVGILSGDKIVGVDGIDVKDDGMLRHIMKVQPGDKVNLTISRDGQRMNFTITALPN
jgi:hypothetical protein